MSHTQHQRLVDAEESIRLFTRSHKRWTIGQIHKHLQERYPTHNIRLYENVNDVVLTKITFDGYEIFKGHNIL